jgi:immunity protein 5 of polymorphic toxin system
MVRSPQTLTEADRRLAAAWAADCAERVLALFEAEAPDDGRPRALIARTRAFARGELKTAQETRRRFVGGVGAGDVKAPAAAAAARAAGQAVAVCHMGAHALGAAAYAANAAGLADPDRPEAVNEEIRWQLEHMSAELRAALRALPPIGQNSSGPLGPGLLASGRLGTIIRDLQTGLARSTGADGFVWESEGAAPKRASPPSRSPGSTRPAAHNNWHCCDNRPNHRLIDFR